MSSQSSSPHVGQETVHALTVAELTSAIRFNLSAEFSRVFVVGEVSGLTRPSSGHLYLTLKDESAQISVIVWRNTAARLSQRKIELVNGQKYIFSGQLDVYPQRGTYSLIVNDAQPIGEGRWERELQRLREKLKSEGLFDAARKRPLPRFPQRVAVITSPTGAAIRDFLQVLERRWNKVQITILPVKVQGTGSAEEIASAFRLIPRLSPQPDVVVVTRGGGSIEDLWSFNEEIVCRAIFDCPIPVISGVGHETDVTLCDLTADVRALTPSEAAERLVPDQTEIRRLLLSLRRQLQHSLLMRFQIAQQQVDQLAQKAVLRKPLDRTRLASMDVDRLQQRLDRALSQRIKHSQQQLAALAGRMDAINPLAVLARGYSLTTDESGQLLIDCESIQPGDTINTRLSSGSISSRIESINRL